MPRSGAATSSAMPAATWATTIPATAYAEMRGQAMRSPYGPPAGRGCVPVRGQVPYQPRSATRGTRGDLRRHADLALRAAEWIAMTGGVTLAIARLESTFRDGREKKNGTAFAFTPVDVLTAFHCVQDDYGDGTSYADDILLYFQ